MKFDVQKLCIERYYDIIKLRAAQALALFITFGFAIRASENFLDAASILALIIPLAAWFLDMVARRHYGAPLAYAAIREDVSQLNEKYCVSVSKSTNGLAFLILDFKGKNSEFLLKIFDNCYSEKLRRKKFYKWYTFRDQLIPSIVFIFFFIVALFATGVEKLWSEPVTERETQQGYCPISPRDGKVKIRIAG